MHRTMILVAALLAASGTLEARDIYISKNTGDNGGDGSKEKPFKLLWKVMAELQEGDHLYVAEGVYNGQKKSGVMPKITVGKVTIEGGWKADFSERDPFTYLSIITGAPDTQADTHEVFQFEDPNGTGCPIVLDGFCIDRGPACYYSGRGEGGTDIQDGYVDTSCWGYQAINKKKSGSDPAIELLGRGSFTVRNMILVNNPWWGIYVKGGGDGEIIIENNFVLGYQGRGIEAITGGGWGKPKWIIRNNTVLCGADMEGRALSLDPRDGYGTYEVENNVLAFGMQSGFMTKFGAKTLSLTNNLFFAFTKGDAGDGGSPVCNVADFEDELSCKNSGNVHEAPQVFAKLDPRWVDKMTQWQGWSGTNFIKPEEVMAVRKLAGLDVYKLPFFPDKTYAGYDTLPEGRINFCLSRYPKQYKQGEELMNWQESILPAIGADGARGVQPFKR